jgi:hypothetical protein
MRPCQPFPVLDAVPESGRKIRGGSPTAPDDLGTCSSHSGTGASDPQRTVARRFEESSSWSATNRQTLRRHTARGEQEAGGEDDSSHTGGPRLVFGTLLARRVLGRSSGGRLCIASLRRASSHVVRCPIGFAPALWARSRRQSYSSRRIDIVSSKEHVQPRIL